MQRYLDAASGLTELTRNKAEQIAKQLVRSGEAASDQAGELVEDLLERQRKNREAVSSLVKSETTRAVRTMGLATTSEVERLEQQVADLERELRRLRESGGRGAASTSSAGRTTSKKTAAKRAAAKKGAKKSAKKTAKKAAKGSGKKTAAKRAAAKKGAKKTAKKATKQASKTSTTRSSSSTSGSGS
ncbi:MAG: phasin family protein [Actinomycetota bacterium]